MDPVASEPTPNYYEPVGQSGKVMRVGDEYRVGPDATNAVPVPEVIANRIAERLDFVAAVKSGTTSLDSELGKELDKTNCIGAMMTLFGMPSPANLEQYLEPHIETQMDLTTYDHYADFARALKSIGKFPAIVLVGYDVSHAFAVLNVTKDGKAAVFQKLNMGTTAPWDVMSLKDVFERYQVDGYTKRLNEMRIVTIKQ